MQQRYTSVKIKNNDVNNMTVVHERQDRHHGGLNEMPPPII